MQHFLENQHIEHYQMISQHVGFRKIIDQHLTNVQCQSITRKIQFLGLYTISFNFCKIYSDLQLFHIQ